MKQLLVIATVIVTVWPTEMLCRDTQLKTPSPAYVVHIPGLWAIEMSPDEKYLAAFVVRKLNGATPTAQVQLWDFRSGILVQTHTLPVPEPTPGYQWGRIYVRFTSDGKLLVLYTGGDSLHVLSTANLEEVRTAQFHLQTNIDGVEVSPTAHLVAVRKSGDVRVYDLDSGEEVRGWTNNQYPEFKMSILLGVEPRLTALAWRRDGGSLAIAVADNSPCLRGGGTIHILELASNKAEVTFRVPLLPSSIAFGTGNDLYVASNTCGGVFTHWTLDLLIFDSTSGQETGKIPAGKVGIRNYIAISASRQILLAYADREKTTFAGFEEGLEIKDEQWQAWDLANGKVVLTLQATEHMSTRDYPALSSSGRFVYANRAQEVDIFSLPVATK